MADDHIHGEEEMEITNSNNHKKKKQRLGGIKTMPFILGEFARVFIFLLLSSCSLLFNILRLKLPYIYIYSHTHTHTRT